MHRFKTFLMGLLSVVFVCGAVGLVCPIASEAMIKEKPAFSQAPLVKKIFKKTVCGFRNPDARFVTSKDGTEVCDRTTGNIWEQNPDSTNRGTMTHPDAIAFCAALHKGYGQVYELPSVQQLVSVLNYTQISPALTPGVFSNIVSNIYWSATGLPNPILAWIVFVESGVVVSTNTTDLRFVWCVRRDREPHGF